MSITPGPGAHHRTKMANPNLEEDWKLRGLCRTDGDPDLWFPYREGDSKYAAAVCRDCPVKQECLDYAIAAGENYGVWGAKTPTQRKHLAEQRAKRLPPGVRRRRSA